MEKTEPPVSNDQETSRLLATPFADLLAKANEIDLADYPSPNSDEEDDFPPQFEVVEGLVVPDELKRLFIVLTEQRKESRIIEEKILALSEEVCDPENLSEEITTEVNRLEKELDSVASRIIELRDFVLGLLRTVNPEISELNTVAIGPGWGIYSWPVQECCGRRHAPRSVLLNDVLRRLILGGLTESLGE